MREGGYFVELSRVWVSTLKRKVQSSFILGYFVIFPLYFNIFILILVRKYPNMFLIHDICGPSGSCLELNNVYRFCSLDKLLWLATSSILTSRSAVAACREVWN